MPSSLTVDVGDEGNRAVLRGALDIRTVGSLTSFLDQLPKVIEKFSAIEDQTKKVMTDVGDVTGKIKDNPLLRLGSPREKAAPAAAESTAPAQKEKTPRSR